MHSRRDKDASLSVYWVVAILSFALLSVLGYLVVVMPPAAHRFGPARPTFFPMSASPKKGFQQSMHAATLAEAHNSASQRASYASGQHPSIRPSTIVSRPLTAASDPKDILDPLPWASTEMPHPKLGRSPTLPPAVPNVAVAYVDKPRQGALYDPLDDPLIIQIVGRRATTPATRLEHRAKLIGWLAINCAAPVAGQRVTSLVGMHECLYDCEAGGRRVNSRECLHPVTGAVEPRLSRYPQITFALKRLLEDLNK